MKSPKFLQGASEAIGKTIDGIGFNVGDVILVSFTDGTALAIRADIEYDDSIALSVEPKVDIRHWKWNSAAQGAGLMTHEEWCECYRKEKIARAKRLQEQAAELLREAR